MFKSVLVLYRVERIRCCYINSYKTSFCALDKASCSPDFERTAQSYRIKIYCLLHATACVRVVFGFAGRIHSDSDHARTPSEQARQHHLQIAGPVFLSVSVATCVIGAVYSRLVKSDWLERQVLMELEKRGGPVRALAVEVIRHRVSPALFHDPDLQHLILSRLRRNCGCAEHW